MIAFAIKFLLGRWVADAEGVVKNEWRWIFATPVHVLMTLLAGSLALNAFEWHELNVRGRTIAKLGGENASFVQAQAQANLIAQQALHHQEAVYQAKASEADSAYQVQLADAQSAADRYIAAHRVRAEAFAGGAGASVAAATGVGPTVSSILPADAVVVSPKDVQACTDATSYAVSAHNWAVSLNQ